MTAIELKTLFRWCDHNADNAIFWARLWYAAQAYDVRTCTLLRGLVATYGIVPQ